MSFFENKQTLFAILRPAGVAGSSQPRVQQVNQIIDRGGLPKDDIEKGQKAIIDKIAQAPTREDAKEELKVISRAVQVIWTLFEVIEDDLVKVDKKRLFRTHNGGEHEPLVPKWKELMEEYRTIIGRSKKTTFELKDSITDLLDNVLPIADLDENVNKYRPKLKEYIESLKKFDTSGLENSKAILRLRQGVSLFYDDFKMRANKTEAHLRHRLETLVKCWQLFGIPTMNLDKIGEQFTNPDSVKSVALATTGVIAMLPVLSISLIASAIGAISGGQVDILGIFSRMGKQKELSDLLTERRQIASQLKLLQELIDEITQAKVTFDSLVYRLVAIEEVCKMLVVDAQRLETKLSAMVEAPEDDDLTPLFTAKTVRETYEVLHIALTMFADGLNRDWIKA